MLKKFIIFVIDDLSESGTPEEMLAIDAFNDSLRVKGQWIFAGGLAAPFHSMPMWSTTETTPTWQQASLFSTPKKITVDFG